MEMYIKFSSNIDGRLCINSTFYTNLELNKKIKLKISNITCLLIEFTPIDNTDYNPFLSKIVFNNQMLFTKSSNIYLINHGKMNFEVYLIAQKHAVYAINHHKLNNKLECNIKTKKAIYQNGILEIMDKNKYKKFEINANIKTCTLDSKFSLFILDCTHENNCIYVYNTETDSFQQLYCNSFDFKEQTLRCARRLNTYANHIEINVYNIHTLQKISSYLTYLKEPKSIKNKKILPYAFMQCVLAKDSKLAHSHLCKETFDQSITNAMLEGFFGNFDSIATPQIPMPENTVCLIYKKNRNTYYSRYFHFEFNNDKISNMSEIKV